MTKKTLAIEINKCLDKTELQFEVLPENIYTTRFTSEQYEGGATKLSIQATHKTNSNYRNIDIYCAYTLGELTEELKKKENNIITIKHHSHDHINELWIWVE